ncbi:MAG TPA: hypothetical protein DEB25_09435, partial [Desulfobulbaceae bacterium]|nr:hypothetical protein [Desulfobulbaceae bacterium]
MKTAPRLICHHNDGCADNVRPRRLSDRFVLDSVTMARVASGWCRRCRRWHWLGLGTSPLHARKLAERLTRKRAIADGAATELATDSLFLPGG